MTPVYATTKQKESPLSTLPLECLQLIILNVVNLSMPDSVKNLLSFETQTSIHTQTHPWPNKEILQLRLVSRFFANFVTPVLFETLAVDGPKTTRRFLETMDPAWSTTEEDLPPWDRQWIDWEGTTKPEIIKPPFLPFFEIGTMVRKLVIWWPGNEIDYCKNPDYRMLAHLFRFCSRTLLDYIVLGGLVVCKWDEDDQNILTSAFLDMECFPRRARIEISGLEEFGWSWHTTDPFLKALQYWRCNLEELVISIGDCSGNEGLVEWDKFKQLRKVHLSRQAHPNYHRGLEILEKVAGKEMERVILTGLDWARLENWPKESDSTVQFIQFDGKGSMMEQEKKAQAHSKSLVD